MYKEINRYSCNYPYPSLHPQKCTIERFPRRRLHVKDIKIYEEMNRLCANILILSNKPVCIQNNAQFIDFPYRLYYAKIHNAVIK